MAPLSREPGQTCRQSTRPGQSRQSIAPPTRTQESGVDARPCSTPCRTELRMLQWIRPSTNDTGAITKLIRNAIPGVIRTRKTMEAAHPDSDE